MYRSKHRKNCITNYKVQTIHFCTWISGKKWLCGVALLTLTVTSVLAVGNLAFLPKVERTHAATISSGTLAPGTNYDTGGHTYSGAEFAQASNYLTYGTANIASPWINLVTNTQSSVGLGIYNGLGSSISSSSGFTLKATLQVDMTIGGLFQDFTSAGDAIGVVFSGASKQQLQNNAQSSNATGSGLGIRGLPNTVFLGRDLYCNLTSDDGSISTGVDGTSGTNGWQSGPGNVIAIRSTNAAGVMANATYPNGTTTGTTTGQAWTQADDSTFLLGITNPKKVLEPVTVTWTPDTTNTGAAGFTSGTLSFKLTSQNALLGSVRTYSISTKMSLQNSLSIGFLGATGGNAGALSVSLKNATLTGNKGTQLVPVNYLNKITGQAIPGMNQSNITANVNDTIGASLTAPTSGTPDSNTYTYVVPTAPTGYSANSASTTTIVATNPVSTTNSSATTVQNFIVGQTNPNILNVSYTPVQQTVNFNWVRAGTSTVPTTLPANKSYGAAGTGVTTDSSVVTDNPFASTTLLKNYASDLTSSVPVGYNITSITNGTSTYTGTTTAATVAAFTAANPTVSAAQASNNYTVTLTAAAQTATFNYGYVSTAQNTPAIPPNVSASGTTGANVTPPTVWNTASTATVANKIPFGYYISAIYAGNSAVGTPIATGTGTTGAGTNAAFPTAGQTYGATGNQYYVQLSPYSVRTSWHISVLGTDPDYLDALGGQYAGYVGGQATPNAQTLMMNDVNNSTPLTTADNIVYTDGAGIRYIITGYTYSLTSNSVAGTTYPTFAALLAANPYVPVGENNTPTQFVTVNMVSDQTSITSNSTSSTTPFTPATNYMPINDITGSTDINGKDDDGLPYAINGYNAVTNITGGTTNYWGDATNSLKLPIGSYTETYYALNYLGLQAYQGQSTYTTVASFLQSLSSANLAKYTVSSTTTLTVADATTISANNQHIIPSASSYNPVSDLVGAKNADGSSVEDIRTNPVVNGDEIGVLITDSSGTVLWVNNSKVSLPSNKFQEGTYTENYYALTAQGLVDYTSWQTTASANANTVGDFINSGQATSSDYVTATTQLTVTNFVLPFAGGSGNQFLYLMISLAAIGALGLYFSKRRKEEEFEFVPEQAGYGASTNTNGNKARFFQTLRKTRPYRKVFHSKNRIHLAQTQRKEGKND